MARGRTRRRRPRIIGIGALGIVAGLIGGTPPASRAQSPLAYTVEEVSPSGGPYRTLRATGINHAGQVVGYLGPTSSKQRNPLDPSFDGQPVVIGDKKYRVEWLPTFGHPNVSFRGMNNRGQILLYDHLDNGTIYVWTDGKVDVIARGYHYPMSLNDRGDVVGHYTPPGYGVEFYAFAFSSDLGFRYGPACSHNSAINAHGDYVGYALLGCYRPEPPRATKNHQQIGPDDSEATRVNDRGDLLMITWGPPPQPTAAWILVREEGGSVDLPGAGDALNNLGQVLLHNEGGLYRWTEERMHQITPSNYCYGHLNDFGDVVGDCAYAYHPFLYTDRDGLVDLPPFVDGNRVSINNCGQIAGQVRFSNNETYRLTPLCPQSEDNVAPGPGEVGGISEGPEPTECHSCQGQIYIDTERDPNILYADGTPRTPVQAHVPVPQAHLTFHAEDAEENRWDCAEPGRSFGCFEPEQVDTDSEGKASVKYRAGTLAPGTTRTTTAIIKFSLNDEAPAARTKVYHYRGVPFDQLSITDAQVEDLHMTAEPIQRFFQGQNPRGHVSFLRFFKMTGLGPGRDGVCDGFMDMNDNDIRDPDEPFYSPTGDTQFHDCGERIRAAQIFYDLATSPTYGFRINPKILLATAQKEHQLISTPTLPTQPELNRAMECYDGTRDFVSQIRCAARTFRRRFDESRSLSYPFFVRVRRSDVDKICCDYIGCRNVGENICHNPGHMPRARGIRVSFSIQNAATKTQYIYTPWIQSERDGGGVLLFDQVWRQYQFNQD